MIYLFRKIISNKKRAVYIASIWTAFILFACFIPSSGLPKVNAPLIDKWAHFIIFAGFSFFWLCVWQEASTVSLITIFSLSVLLGYLVELIQGSNLVRGRGYELNDVIADTIGGAIGCLMFTWFLGKSRKEQ